MPTKAFYNLNENKKVTILNAAKEEFKKYTYDQISINRIIRSIDLPRGSFYLYFKDKEDLYLYVLSEYHNIILDYIISIAYKYNNNIIILYKEIFEKLTTLCSNDIILKNYILGLNYNIESKVIYEMVESLASKLVVSNIKKESLIDILLLLTSILIHNLTAYYIFNLDLEIVRKRYYNQLDIISRGINNI